MNSRTPYSSHIADHENHDSASDLNTFPTWPQTSQMQADADLVHDAQLVFPEASLGLAFQATSLQPQSYVWRQIFLPQDDAGLLRIPSDFDTSGLSQSQLASSQAPSPCELNAFAMEGDDHPPFVTPVPSQDQVADLDAPTDNPCPLCGRNFRRSQDRNRHIRTFLPHWVYCPFPRCPWRGDRPDNLRAHWKTTHAKCGQVLNQEHCKIYDPALLVKSVVDRESSIESAAYVALLEVERRAQELGKIGIWTDWWGRPQKIFEH